MGTGAISFKSGGIKMTAKDFLLAFLTGFFLMTTWLAFFGCAPRHHIGNGVYIGNIDISNDPNCRVVNGKVLCPRASI